MKYNSYLFEIHIYVGHKIKYIQVKMIHVEIHLTGLIPIHILVNKILIQSMWEASSKEGL